MEICSSATLRKKEVINICDGSRLGYASEFEIDLCTGCVISIVIPGDCGFLGFNRSDDIIVAWDKIQCIGEDTILVRMNEGDIIKKPTPKCGGKC
jgi:YlmC/YmxH family sporulation protein